MAVFLALSFSSIGQDFEINGRIVDAETGQPLPYANIQIQKTSRGTTTNAEGNFKLTIPEKYADSNLRISYLGYSTKEIPIPIVSHVTIISLKPESRQLQDVIIMPDSSLIVFLRDAYKSIERNYAQEPYELEGFFRESLKNENDIYLYYGEAQLKVQGSGYQFKNEKGNVKVLKSRVNHFAAGDTTRNTLYYGGVFLPISADAVKNRWDVLKPDRKNYQYQLLTTTLNDGKEVWIIGFEKKEGGTTGKLFIEKESRAYLRTEFSWDGRDSIGGNFLSHVKSMERSSQVLYKEFNGKWFLQYLNIHRRDYNKRLKANTIIAGEFATTKIVSDSVILLPFMERMGYTDIFSQLTNNFKTDFWDGTTTLVQDSSLKAQITPYITEQKRNQLLNDTLSLPQQNNPQGNLTYSSKGEKIIKFVTRLGFSYGTQLLPYSIDPTQLSLTYNSGVNTLNFNASLESFRLPLLLSNEFSFRLNRRWQLFTSSVVDLSKKYEFKSRHVGLRYSMLLNQRGRPLLLRPEFSFGSHNFAWNFPTFKNEGEFIFDGSEIDAEQLRFLVGERVVSIKPSVSIEKKIGGLKSLFVNAGYYVPVNRENRLYLYDKSGFIFFRKERSILLEGSGASVLENNLPLPTNPTWFTNFYLEAGIRWTFDF